VEKMNEIDTMKLLIRHEYEEDVKGKWNKQNFTDYLIEKFAELRVSQASTEQSKLNLTDVINCNSCKWHKSESNIFPCEFCNNWDNYEKLLSEHVIKLNCGNPCTDIRNLCKKCLQRIKDDFKKQSIPNI
jgi:hypothetical protein